MTQWPDAGPATPGFQTIPDPSLWTSSLVLEQCLGRSRDQLRTLPRPAFEEQQALAEDETVEQEGPGVGFVVAKAGRAIELADVLQPRRVDAGDRPGRGRVGSCPLPDRQL